MSFFNDYNLTHLENLELLARQVVEGFIIGLHKSPFHGFSVEFAEHRIYNVGESSKNIDWKVFARTDRLYTKKYEEETNLRCQIVIDTSSSMYFPHMDVGEKEVLNKLQFSSVAAASLMNLLLRQRDAFGLSLFEDQLHSHTLCKSSTSHYKNLLFQLDNLIQNPKLNKKTSASEALHEIAERMHRRSLIILFSDMFEKENTEEIIDALHHLKHNKHEVIMFHVLDVQHELEFEYEDRPYQFEDMESGEKIKMNPFQYKSEYRAKILERKEIIKLNCLQYKIDYIEADINLGFLPILNRFLIKRSKMNI